MVINLQPAEDPSVLLVAFRFGEGSSCLPEKSRHDERDMLPYSDRMFGYGTRLLSKDWRRWC